MTNRLPLVLSVTALVVAVLGATPVGNAAMNLVVPRNSVGTLQLKANAVTAAKVKNGSLLSADFQAGPDPAGPQGAAGPKGLRVERAAAGLHDRREQLDRDPHR
jgi:hypothetical protein